MNLPKSYSPLDEATAAGCRDASFHRLGEQPWTGTVALVVDGVRRDFTVEEMSTVWKLTGGGRSTTGSSLSALIKKAGTP